MVADGSNSHSGNPVHRWSSGVGRASRRVMNEAEVRRRRARDDPPYLRKAEAGQIMRIAGPMENSLWRPFGPRHTIGAEKNAIKPNTRPIREHQYPSCCRRPNPN